MRRSPQGSEEADFPRLGPDQAFRFPDPSREAGIGVVCRGGNLSPGMLLSAYRQGLFPWYGPGEPILWWSPDPRFVLYPQNFHIPKSLRRFLRKEPFRYTLDRDFTGVIRRCAQAPRPGQEGTWITEEMAAGYEELHRLGFAHSAEAWDGNDLAGGLYGVSLGSLFFGESMFSRCSNASKAVFSVLVLSLRQAGFTLIDSQVYTDHVAAFGAAEIPREAYLRELRAGLGRPVRRGNWGELFPDYPESRDYQALLAGNLPSSQAAPSRSS